MYVRERIFVITATKLKPARLGTNIGIVIQLHCFALSLVCKSDV